MAGMTPTPILVGTVGGTSTTTPFTTPNLGIPSTGAPSTVPLTAPIPAAGIPIPTPLVTHTTHGGAGPSYTTLVPPLGGNLPHMTPPLGGIGPNLVQPTTVSHPSSSLPFMASLNLPDLARLTNDPIRHDPAWPHMPTKLPSDIPKFEGKAGEDPQNHIMSFHLWCSSNSIVDDSIRLHLLQRTFTGSAAKWYIEQPHGTHATFTSLASTYLQFFQLPVRYDTGVEILLSYRQNMATHITDHIHEWHRHRSLCKIKLDDRIFLDWFLKSLFLSLLRMWHSKDPSLKKRPSLRPNNSTLFTPSWVISIPSYLTPSWRVLPARRAGDIPRYRRHHWPYLFASSTFFHSTSYPWP